MAARRKPPDGKDFGRQPADYLIVTPMEEMLMAGASAKLDEVVAFQQAQVLNDVIFLAIP